MMVKFIFITILVISLLLSVSCGNEPTAPEGGSATVYLSNASAYDVTGKLYVDGNYEGSRSVDSGEQESWTFSVNHSTPGLIEVWADGDFIDDLSFTISPGENRTFYFGK